MARHKNKRLDASEAQNKTDAEAKAASSRKHNRAHLLRHCLRLNRAATCPMHYQRWISATRRFKQIAGRDDRAAAESDAKACRSSGI